MILLNRIEIKWKFIQRNDTSESHSFLSNLLIFIYNMFIASSAVENYEKFITCSHPHSFSIETIINNLIYVWIIQFDKNYMNLHSHQIIYTSHWKSTILLFILNILYLHINFEKWSIPGISQSDSFNHESRIHTLFPLLFILNPILTNFSCVYQVAGLRCWISKEQQSINHNLIIFLHIV